MKEQSKWQLRGSYATSIVSITLVLIMLGIIGLLALNANKLSQYFRENITLTVVFKKETKEVAVFRRQKILDAADWVQSTKYISADEAAKELQKELGEEFVNYLGYNPLHTSIEVVLAPNYSNPDSIQMLQKQLDNYSEIKETHFQKSLVEFVNTNVRNISLLIIIIGGLLFAIAITLINNTIRLSVYAKRFVIRTQQLVGATDGFIARPFVTTGLLHGGISALIAIGAITGLMYVVRNQVPQILSLLDIMLLFMLIIVVGMGFAALAARFAVRRHLLQSEDALYG